MQQRAEPGAPRPAGGLRYKLDRNRGRYSGRRLGQTCRGHDVEVLSLPFFQREGPSVLPGLVMFDARRRLALSLQDVHLAQAKVLRRVQLERRRIPPHHFMSPALRRVQTRLDGWLILRNGIERPVEDSAISAKREVRGG